MITTPSSCALSAISGRPRARRDLARLAQVAAHAHRLRRRRRWRLRKAADHPANHAARHAALDAARHASLDAEVEALLRLDLASAPRSAPRSRAVLHRWLRGHGRATPRAPGLAAGEAAEAAPHRLHEEGAHARPRAGSESGSRSGHHGEGQRAAPVEEHGGRDRDGALQAPARSAMACEEGREGFERHRACHLSASLRRCAPPAVRRRLRTYVTVAVGKEVPHGTSSSALLRLVPAGVWHDSRAAALARREVRA